MSSTTGADERRPASLYATPFRTAPRRRLPPGHPDLHGIFDRPLGIASALIVPVGPGVRRSPTRGRLVGALGALCLVISFTVLGFSLWESVGTNLYAAHAQHALHARFRATMAATPPPTVLARRRAPSTRPAIARVLPPAMPVVGAIAGRLVIPSIGVDAIVLAGTGARQLRNGPGLWPTGVAPGAPGNATISGHRTTYGGPFRNLDELRVGDRIRFQSPGHLDAVFEVRGAEVVAPSAVVVTEQGGGVRLTLTTCEPVGSAAKRLVVQAELVEGELAALALPRDRWRLAG